MNFKNKNFIQSIDNQIIPLNKIDGVQIDPMLIKIPKKLNIEGKLVINEKSFVLICEENLFTEIQSEYIREIISINNHHLKKIYAPQATNIDCRNNSQIEEIDAPLLESIQAEGCNNLKKINASKILSLQIPSLCLSEYYAYVENQQGWVKELKIDKNGKLNCRYLDLYGELHTNAKEIICNDNGLSKIFASNAEKICCDNNFIVYINAPNCVEISYEYNPLLERSNMILSPDYQEKNQVKQYKK